MRPESEAAGREIDGELLNSKHCSALIQSNNNVTRPVNLVNCLSVYLSVCHYTTPTQGQFRTICDSRQVNTFSVLR
jgi:hypothetical protein